LPGLIRLDPAIHFLAKKMDPRVKPAGDVQNCVACGLPQFMTSSARANSFDLNHTRAVVTGLLRARENRSTAKE
jgi:hypothetical protein